MTTVYSSLYASGYIQGAKAYVNAKQEGRLETWDRACPYPDGNARKGFCDGWVDASLAANNPTPEFRKSA